jgi:hypothetical protein
MPLFTGLNTLNIGNGLIQNALGTVAQKLFPNPLFTGFGLGATTTSVGQSKLQQTVQDQFNHQDFRRVSLRPRPQAASIIYGTGLLKVLQNNGGLIWPYTPTISTNQNVDYQPIATVHTNQDFHVYSKTPALEIQVNGEFTVQNQLEGQYALAALHFMRTVTKMNFGDSDSNAGTPPPVLLFNAYGPFVFNDVPVIVKSYTMEFPKDVDYVQVIVQGQSGAPKTSPTPNNDTRNAATQLPSVTQPPQANFTPNSVLGNVPGASKVLGSLSNLPGQLNLNTTTTSYTVWLPSVFSLQASLIVSHTPKSLRTFNLPAYRNGSKDQRSFV